MSPSPSSTRRLRLRESPCAVEDFGSRAKQANRVVPALRDRQAIGNFAVSAAELDGNCAVRALFRGDAVHRIEIGRVRLEVTLAVVDGERPETVYRHLPHPQLVDGAAVITSPR